MVWELDLSYPLLQIMFKLSFYLIIIPALCMTINGYLNNPNFPLKLNNILILALSLLPVIIVICIKIKDSTKQ